MPDSKVIFFFAFIFQLKRAYNIQGNTNFTIQETDLKRENCAKNTIYNKTNFKTKQQKYTK